MEIILLETIDRLGGLGDMVNVRPGFARNYLLPQGLAKVATEESIRSVAEEKAKRAEQRIQEKKRLEIAAKAVEGAEAVIAAKANEQGHLFGSVTAHHIAVNLREQGFEVADEIVRLPEHIKNVGTHEVKLKYANDLTVTVNVIVVPEQDTISQDVAEQSTTEQKEIT